jgi:hypothetical protein
MVEKFAKKEKNNGVPHVVSTMCLVDINVNIYLSYIAQSCLVL